MLFTLRLGFLALLATQVVQVLQRFVCVDLVLLAPMRVELNVRNRVELSTSSFLVTSLSLADLALCISLVKGARVRRR